MSAKKVVLAALAGNVAIAACKLGAAYMSHSTATLAEAVHSLADTGNQALLLVGMRLAARPADERYAFGRATERYFWPFVVALLLFAVGGAFAVSDGISHLVHPDEGATARGWSYAVLGVSFAMEGASFQVAYAELRAMAAGRSLRQTLVAARDPTVLLVLAEDTTALLGLAIALAAILTSQLTGQGWWDPVGGITIGVLLCAVALGLAYFIHGLLIGESATPEDQRRVLEIARGVDGVLDVTQLLTLHLGPDVVLIALKVAFRPTITLAELEATTDAIEAAIRKDMPHMRKIFIEADSRGDRRGAPAEEGRGRALSPPPS